MRHYIRAFTTRLGLILSFAVVLPAFSMDEDRASRVMNKLDKDGDGRISRQEWRKKGIFDEVDANADGAVDLGELRQRFGVAAPGGAQPGVTASTAMPGLIAVEEIDELTRCGIGRAPGCNIADAEKLGLVETGLVPVFPGGARCPEIDETWAMDYSNKRDRAISHGGIDMPAPFGTPIVAAADGVVVAKYPASNSFRGAEIILRHGPEDTGLPFWVYTQYAHFDKLPTHAVGQRVQLGEVLGPNGNSGWQPQHARRARRPAIHFAVWYSDSERYAETGRKVIPEKGQWMDPNALYRTSPPYDSHSLRDLPADQKQVSVPYIVGDRTVVPADAKRVWPFRCSAR